ncbi:TetR/AcrR family transcriptional regulator [Microvirga terricola]|uniref:TetR/AcrR family transcriptional regulator n=1 Tax=Microvirga terricola TaxID=2719797 RepID=A0ABX0V6X1_9HYPH|nr:TetR/AcrR family transcriptional regulator [Microvirga terricola]NIX75587.1 TetR/AcrR family transcriptional regulator [Microvirga terricola]
MPRASPLKVSRRPSRRAPARSEEDRQEKFNHILDAALDVFSEKGFARSRLEDVAARAGIAKGTIYLYVPSKQGLFEALIHSGIGGAVEELEGRLTSLDGSAEMQLRALFHFFRTEILGTRRRNIVRLLIVEAERIPALADFYYREVLTRALRLLRTIACDAVARGEFTSDELVRFPQLIVAPGLVALIWSELFQRIEPIDIEAMFEAHLSLLMRALKEDAA